MEYKRKIKIDKNFVGIYAMAAVILAAGAICCIWFSAFIGTLCIIAGLFVCWIIAKTMKKILSSRILTYSEGLTVFNADGSKMAMEWKDVSHAGKITGGKFAGHVFMYDESADQFIQLPPIFHDFDKFEAELKEHFTVDDVNLEENESVRDYIKGLVS